MDMLGEGGNAHGRLRRGRNRLDTRAFARTDPLKEFGAACRAAQGDTCRAGNPASAAAAAGVLTTSGALTDLPPNADASLTTPAQRFRTLSPDRFSQTRTP